MSKRNLIIVFVLLVGSLLVFFSWFLLFPKAGLKIVAEAPKKQTTDANPFSTISVTFSRKMDYQEQKQTQISPSPPISGSQTWSADGKTLVLKPEVSLTTSQTYTITVVYPNNQYIWSFQTLPFEKLSLGDQAKLQTEADRIFAEEERKIFETYPFYSQLPILTDRHFLYFDIEGKVFVGKLYTRGNKNLVESYKQEVLTTLSSLGIDPTLYPIIWVEIP